jgi:hypothetical protein
MKQMTENKESLHLNGTEKFQQSDENWNKQNLSSPSCKNVGRTQPSGNVMRRRPSNTTQKQNATVCIGVFKTAFLRSKELFIMNFFLHKSQTNIML